MDIGDGLKLTKDANPKLLELFNNQTDEKSKHYVTKEQHDNEIKSRIAKDYTISKEAYNKHIQKRLDIANAWDELNEKERAFLMDYQYGVKGGLATFPNLMDAIRKKDVEAIKKESPRYEIKKDKNGKIISKKPLGRNAYMLQRADELYTD